MKISVVFTTYNHPVWLEKVLWGFAVQTFKDFEVVIADDGSTKETAEIIENIKTKVDYPIQHIWHEDDGFKKCEILNKAIVASKADYLVFTDGDCIPRADFLEIHFKRRKPNHFLSGGLIRLPMDLSKKICKEDILSQKAFNKSWLKNNGLENKFFKHLKLTKKEFIADFMNKITPTNPSWNGHNASTWKENVLAVNGFDERMQYGGQDREFGERLMNMRVKPIQIRYSAVCLHLDHSRGYAKKESILKNKNIRKNTRQQKIFWTPYGIEKREK